MPTKKQKQAVIRQLLIPIILIIAALLYQPVKGLFVSKEKPVETKADGGSLTVSYIDVGQGDATLIQKGNFSMLIDAGKNEKGQMVVSYLKKKGIKKLNILVGTHPDSDHVGGLDDVINNVQVDTVYLPEAKKQTKTYRDVESALKSVNKTAQMPEYLEKMGLTAFEYQCGRGVRITDEAARALGEGFRQRDIACLWEKPLFIYGRCGRKSRRGYDKRELRSRM